MPEKIRLLVARMIALLAAREYPQIVAMTHGVRLSTDEIAQAVDEYGRTLSIPPESGYELLDVVQIDAAGSEQYSVRMPLWTQEEGRSDLTLELRITVVDEKLEVELDDIHVL